MRKIYLALIGGALVLTAAPAFATTIVAGPFADRHQCVKWVPWSSDQNGKSGWKDLYPDLRNVWCQQIAGSWYIVTD